MDTIQIIKINNDQILVTLNNTQTIKLDLKFDDLKNIIRKINHDILGDYIISGSDKNKLNQLKKKSYELFNILNFFDFKDFFIELKKNNYNHIQLIVDQDTNCIPFENLHDGKDFLSDYIIFSRVFIDSIRKDNDNNLIKSNNPFSIICNPSESSDIMDETNNECNYISELVNTCFDLRGPYKKRYVNKIELIHLLGISTCFHFSGHYKSGNQKSGWKLFDDIFTTSDIKKISKAPQFIFSNSCGVSSGFFIHSLLKKGTQNIISSSGKLPSKKAAEFSQNFYKYFITKNLNLGESVFFSRKDMIQQYGKQDLFWCFYQIYGSNLLKIHKESNRKKINSKHKFIKFTLFLILLILSYVFISNNNLEIDKSVVQSNTTLEKLIIMNNNIKVDDYFDISLDTVREFKILNNKESIYLKLINNKPYFSLDEKFERLELFIHSDYDIQKLFNYDNDTLNLFFNNKSIYENKNYHKIHIDLGHRYKDIKVFLKKDDVNSSIYELYLFDDNNRTRYKVLINKLILESEIYDVITKSQFDKIADPKKNILSESYKNQMSDIFDLIKDNTMFNKELIIYIKKALIK